MGAVFSHTEGFTRIGEMWGSIGFHVVFTGLGMFCLGKAGVGQQADSDKIEVLQPASRGQTDNV